MTEHFSEHYDAVSFLAAEYELILEKLFELEHKISGYNNTFLTADETTVYLSLFNKIYEQTVKYFRMEEQIVFLRLAGILPQQASPQAMKNEHDRIIETMYVLQDKINKKELTELHLIQTEILKITGDFQRIYHRKQDVMYRELYTYLDDISLDEMYEEMKKYFYLK